MSRNLNYENGVVGKFKGIEVQVMSYEEYKKIAAPQSTIIYALSFGAEEDLSLVLNKIYIGHMTPEGDIIEERQRPFRGKKPEKEEKKKEIREEKKEIDLNELSKPIDDFIQKALSIDWEKKVEVK